MRSLYIATDSPLSYASFKNEIAIVMFRESSHFYDLLYSFKDYKKESEEIINLIKLKKPDSRTILDIGCGTGEHHKYLKNEFQIDGIDINKEFINLAKVKNPGGTYQVADMTDFKLNKEYDGVICLFSSIGYVKTFEKMASAMKCFFKHLKNDGLVIVEPWLTPENWHDGKLHMLTYDKEDVKICRINQSNSKGKLSILDFHYLYGSSEKGVNHFVERHELALFTKEEMKKAFSNAGLDVTFDEVGITGRGIYYGRKKNISTTTKPSLGGY
jgi:ubiquinone/menaquinone biosynthesis C-methylase UbiE